MKGDRLSSAQYSFTQTPERSVHKSATDLKLISPSDQFIVILCFLLWWRARYDFTWSAPWSALWSSVRCLGAAQRCVAALPVYELRLRTLRHRAKHRHAQHNSFIPDSMQLIPNGAFIWQMYPDWNGINHLFRPEWKFIRVRPEWPFLNVYMSISILNEQSFWI